MYWKREFLEQLEFLFEIKIKKLYLNIKNENTFDTVC